MRVINPNHVFYYDKHSDIFREHPPKTKTLTFSAMTTMSSQVSPRYPFKTGCIHILHLSKQG